MRAIDKDRLVQLFLELVRIDAISLHERPVVDYVCEKLKAWGFEFIEDDAGEKTGGNAGNLIVPVAGEGGLRLFMGAHTDTVRPTANLKPKVQNGAITSDGTTILGADNRAGMAVLLYLLDEIARGWQHHCSLDIVFTIAEEIGLVGANHLDWQRVEAPFGYIFDCSRPPGQYVAQTPTAMELVIDLEGKPAHAGVAPERGVNAVSMAAEVLTAFPVGRVDAETVANVGIIRGGEATNVVPANVHMEGEIRSFNLQTIERMISQLEHSLQIVAEKYGGKYTLHHAVHFSGFTIPEDHLIAKRLQEKMRQVGLDPAPQIYHGGSDANVYNAAGKTAINIGIGARNPHGNDELILIDDLVKDVELAMALVEM